MLMLSNIDVFQQIIHEILIDKYQLSNTMELKFIIAGTVLNLLVAEREGYSPPVVDY